MVLNKWYLSTWSSMASPTSAYLDTPIGITPKRGRGPALALGSPSPLLQCMGGRSSHATHVDYFPPYRCCTECASFPLGLDDHMCILFPICLRTCPNRGHLQKHNWSCMPPWGIWYHHQVCNARLPTANYNLLQRRWRDCVWWSHYVGCLWWARYYRSTSEWWRGVFVHGNELCGRTSARWCISSVLL